MEHAGAAGNVVLTPSWSSWAATDTGAVRSGNEDAFVDRPDARLWAVADGAGGMEHGEIASAELKATLEAPVDLTGAELMGEIRARVTAVHHALRSRADEESVATGRPVTIASTLVVFMTQEAHFACLWCGDSRAYLLRKGLLTPLTRDHSLVQELVDTGVLDGALAEKHPHANVLTRAVGGDVEAPELDKITGQAEPGDRFVLCSDGLFKALDQEAIGQLASGGDPARALIDAALANAARDNVTAVVIAPDFAAEDPTIRERLAG
jgi:serine/threonine protein phosphatase Stp1